LKPDVSTLRRRSESSDCTRARKQRVLLPCENDQAKPDRISRLARSTNLSKILTAYPPERAVWIEAQAVTPRCPRTCCAHRFFAYYRILRRFCANLLKLSDFQLHVKLNRFSPPGRSTTMLADCSSVAVFDRPGRRSPARKRRTAQNIKERPAKSARAAWARGS
jgi:hypothetical protein